MRSMGDCDPVLDRRRGPLHFPWPMIAGYRL